MMWAAAGQVERSKDAMSKNRDAVFSPLCEVRSHVKADSAGGNKETTLPWSHDLRVMAGSGRTTTGFVLGK